MYVSGPRKRSEKEKVVFPYFMIVTNLECLYHLLVLRYGAAQTSLLRFADLSYFYWQICYWIFGRVVST